MKSAHSLRPLLPILGCLLLLAACGPNAPAAQQTPAQPGCPAPATATHSGPITMPALSPGAHPNIVYYVSYTTKLHQPCSILKRYDVTTSKTYDIAAINNESIQNAQISADGQWVLFITTIGGSGSYKVHIIRMDGNYLQTLSTFEEAVGDFQWSPDQKSVMFDIVGLPGAQVFKRLDLTTGKTQTELVERAADYFTVHNWLDTKRVYVVDRYNALATSLLQHLYLLNTAKGPNQHVSDLQFVTQLASPYAWSFDSSSADSSLFISRCRCMADAQTGNLSQQGPSTISAMSATGSSQQTVYSSGSLAITGVRAINRNTLLFLVENTSGDTSQNGLWKINSDGTGLLRLTTEKVGESSSFDHYPLYYQPSPWSNVSRDGSMYALQVDDHEHPSADTGTLLFGSLGGGSSKIFAANSELVGWTLT